MPPRPPQIPPGRAYYSRMRRILALATLGLAAAAGDPKPEPAPRWAPSWDAAVEEARALNLPIVVHRHGFY